MKAIPVNPVPFQTFNTELNNQKTNISLYQKAKLLYIDIFLDGAPIVTTRVCRNKIRVLLDAGYKGYVGDFVVVDTKGDTQPQFDGLGSRYQLLYLEPTDLA